MSSWKVYYEVPNSQITIIVDRVIADSETEADELAHMHIQEILPDVDCNHVDIEEW